ncbi:hypothetical protein ACLWD5_001746 [Campylobacter coli]
MDNWDVYNINCFRTQKGTKYFNEILAPKFLQQIQRFRSRD